MHPLRINKSLRLMYICILCFFYAYLSVCFFCIQVNLCHKSLNVVTANQMKSHITHFMNNDDKCLKYNCQFSSHQIRGKSRSLLTLRTFLGVSAYLPSLSVKSLFPFEFYKPLFYSMWGVSIEFQFTITCKFNVW